jgi:hypothetical protein
MSESESALPKAAAAAVELLMGACPFSHPREGMVMKPLRS